MKTARFLAAAAGCLLAVNAATAQKIDWKATQVSSSSSVLNPGWKVTVKMTVKNNSQVMAPPVLATIVVAGDAAGQTCPTTLGMLSFPALAGGKDHEASAIFDLPVKLPDGQVWLIGDVNPAKRHAETNYLNNKASVTATGKGLVDLVAKDITSTETVVQAGGSTKVTWEVLNDSCVRSVGAATALYLSTDATIDTSDTKLLAAASRSLEPDASEKLTFTASLASTLAGGTYWLGVIADHDDKIGESDETNNTKAVQIRVYRKGAFVFVAGGDCKGSNGKIPFHQARMVGERQDPHVGSTPRYLLAAGPANSAALLAIGASKTSWGALPLPFDLGVLGATGCQVFTSADIFLPISLGGSGKGRLDLAIPNDPGLVDTSFYTQIWVVDPSANKLGMTLTRAIETKLGSQ